MRCTSYVLTVAGLLILSGCGGGSSPTSSATPTAPTDTTPEEIKGIATPPSVAVVTATNAQ